MRLRDVPALVQLVDHDDTRRNLLAFVVYRLGRHARFSGTKRYRDLGSSGELAGSRFL